MEPGIFTFVLNTFALTEIFYYFFFTIFLNILFSNLRHTHTTDFRKPHNSTPWHGSKFLMTSGSYGLISAFCRWRAAHKHFPLKLQSLIKVQNCSCVCFEEA